MSASLLVGLAVAGSSGATTPDAATSVSFAPEKVGQTTVATTPDTAAETSLPATSESAAVEIRPPDESWGGLSRGEWDARSWQWLFSFPEDVSPWFDTTDERCGYGQFGPLFFVLGGSPRTCVVAEGTAIYVSVSGVECSTVEPPPWFGRTEEELRACANSGLDEQGSMVRASVNGQDVADLDAYRITSPLFTVTLPEDNVLGVEKGVAQAVSASYGFIIAPPAPGRYEIAWSVRDPSATEPRPTSRVTVIVEAPQVVTSADTATSSPVDSAAASSWEPDVITWTEMIPGFEDGYLDVPIDYAHPDDGMVRLYMWRRLADDPDARVGSLLVPGSGFAYYEADRVLDDEVLEAFDIIGFDRRGTGGSTPAIDCIDDYDHFYSGTDITPDDDAERQQIIDLAEEFANACVANNPEIIQFIGTNNAARDIDSIRRALGEDKISYYSYWDEGYGSELGGVWATMFPTTVRAAVLDAAPDPNNDGNRALVQAEGYENELSTYLAECSADPGCAFHNDGDAEGAFDDLMLQLDSTPIPSRGGRPAITRGVALTAVTLGLVDVNNWPYMSAALDSAQQGSGSGLLRGYDIYFGYNGDGTWSNYREVIQAISCMDSDERPTVAEANDNAAMFSEVAPRLYPPGTTGNYFCTFFPTPTDPRIEITGAGAGPILVCGTDHPDTPLQGTRNMAEALEDSYLIVVDDNNAWCAGISQCADGPITEYLVNLDLPAATETYCTRNSRSTTPGTAPPSSTNFAPPSTT